MASDLVITDATHIETMQQFLISFLLNLLSLCRVSFPLHLVLTYAARTHIKQFMASPSKVIVYNFLNFDSREPTTDPYLVVHL